MSRSHADRLLAGFLGLLAATAASMVVLIVVFVAMEAWPSLYAVGPFRFLFDESWRPTAGDNAQFGIAAMLAGSMLVTAGAMALSVPLGLLVAMFCVFYAPSFVGSLVTRLVEMLNGVPSVLVGFWGLLVIVPRINQWHPPGQSLLAGILVLSLMILPTVALMALAALRSVPDEIYTSATALGLGRWAIVWNLALPQAKRGILAGVILAMARAIGETMAVVMVCGNIVQVPASLFDPVRTVTANIALEMGYATASHRSALFVSGLVLMLLIAAAIALAELVRGEDQYA